MAIEFIILILLALQRASTECHQKCLCVDSTVRCIFTQMKTVPQFLPSSTQTLDLRFNKIRHIPRGSFQNLTQLNTLLLNNNKLRRLRNGVFGGLNNLQHLYLYSNKIRLIEADVFQDVPNLEHLYLHHNYIKSISPKLFQGLPNLNRVFLHNNTLQTIPTGTFSHLPSLQRLRLDENPLHCDCNLKWFVDFASASKFQLSAFCLSPAAFANQTAASVGGSMICDGPHFVEEPTDADVTPGGSILFTCRVKHKDKLIESVEWSKDGVKVRPNHRVQILGTTLLIANAQKADIGVYKCHYSDQLTSRPARVRFYQGRSKPTILHSPTHSEVEKGSTIRLNCVANGFPKPTFAWYKDGGRLSTAHSRYKIEENGTLVITNAQLGDSGHYRCSASNYLGRVSSAAKVKVNLDIPDAVPQITTLPRDADIKEGLFVEFTCVASGQPYPDISWWNNNRLVNSDSRIQVSNGGQHLRIEDARPYDSGHYTCRAQNRLGQIEAVAELRVKSKPSPLQLIVWPHDMVAPKGTTVQMPCKASGSPAPTIKWLKDGHQMDSRPRFDIRPDGSLIIQGVTEEDEGMYQCVADNGLQRQTAEARFTLRQPRQTSEDATYNIGEPTIGDEYVLVALEEAKTDIDKALNSTIDRLFSGNVSISNSTPGQLLRVFRYPPENQRAMARAAEIYQRTLELVAQKVSNSSHHKSSNFTYQDLLSPLNLQLLANLSGCEAHRGAREVNCTQDMCFHAKYRTVDGTCNNFQKPLQGSSLTTFKRILPPYYENGLSTPMGWQPDQLHNGFKLPSARKVSSEIISTSDVTEDDGISHMVMQWGQFLDHDMDHSMEAISRETFENGITCSATCHNQPPCFPIKIEGQQGGECMEFTRSSAACGSGSTSVFFSKLQKREQINQLTSYIDASQVYGSNLDLAISLRNLTNEMGRLREGLGYNYGKPLLPFNARHVIDCRRDPTQSNIGCFLTGDVRANEQLGLISMHTLWFREHNRLASQLRQLNPHWDGDKLYEEARKIVGAQMQHITFKHWLPLIIGDRQIGPYSAYQPQVDASISNVFAASAFRFGHTLVKPVLRRLDAELRPIPEGDLPLHQAFFAPWRIVQEGGIDPILRGLFASPAKKNLPHQLMNSELTEKLFGAVHAVALDLGALNIQRGRDHGLPPYVKWRLHCGLDPEEIGDWTALGSAIESPSLVEKLRQLYGHPGNIDLWVGGLLERPKEGARVGPTVQCLLMEQFKRLRDGDRFWYENPSTFTKAQLDQIQQSSLARIICDNGDDVRRVFSDVFQLNSSSVLIDCAEIGGMSLNPWHECQVDPTISRQQRVRRSSESEDDPSGERVEGLEVVIMKNKIEMSKMKRRLARIYKAMVNIASVVKRPVKDAVCIDFQGGIKSPNETWIHQNRSNCARCICQNGQISCQKVVECQ